MRPLRKTSKALLAVPLIALVAMAGCLEQLGLQDDSDNEAPEAHLETTKDVGWTSDEFTFDAQGSSDPDGEIVSWRFDFGDGQTMEVTSEDEARVQHRYAEGGEYVVTLTVTDDGGEQTGALTDTAEVRIAVNQEYIVPEQAVYSTPVGGNQSAESSMDFAAHEGSDRFELELELDSLLAAGSSEVTIQVISPSDEVLDEETVSLSAGSGENVSLSGEALEQGDYTVKVTADSGASVFGGEFAIFYDDGF